MQKYGAANECMFSSVPKRTGERIESIYHFAMQRLACTLRPNSFHGLLSCVFCLLIPRLFLKILWVKLKMSQPFIYHISTNFLNFGTKSCQSHYLFWLFSKIFSNIFLKLIKKITWLAIFGAKIQKVCACVINPWLRHL